MPSFVLLNQNTTLRQIPIVQIFYPVCTKKAFFQKSQVCFEWTEPLQNVTEFV